jgi:hypothetical protein
VVIDIIEAHAAIWAVLVFHNHRHGIVGGIAGEYRDSKKLRDRLKDKGASKRKIGNYFILKERKAVWGRGSAKLMKGTNNIS